MLALKNFAVIIATRNRKFELCNLLESISRSSIIPNRIIIVYSGEPIFESIASFQKQLNLKIFRSEVSSQTYQKKLGISFLLPEEKWVLFLDDDVILENSTISDLFKNYIDNVKMHEFVGFGLALSKHKEIKLNPLTRWFLIKIKLYSNSPGLVLKSGHPQSYLNQNTSFEVNWLNGISAWRSDTLADYGLYDFKTSYSAYEDVIFSYSVSKKYKLYFCSDLIVQDQNLMHSKYLTNLQFISGSYLRYFFVDINKELSKFYLLVSQIVRSIDFIKQGYNFSTILARFWLSFKIWLDLVVSTFLNRNSQELVENRLR